MTARKAPKAMADLRPAAAHETGHRYCWTTGARAGSGYLQPDGTLTKASGGGTVLTSAAATAILALHHLALDCRACGTGR